MMNVVSEMQLERLSEQNADLRQQLAELRLRLDEATQQRDEMMKRLKGTETGHRCRICGRDILSNESAANDEDGWLHPTCMVSRNLDKARETIAALNDQLAEAERQRAACAVMRVLVEEEFQRLDRDFPEHLSEIGKAKHQRYSEVLLSNGRDLLASREAAERQSKAADGLAVVLGWAVGWISTEAAMSGLKRGDNAAIDGQLDWLDQANAALAAYRAAKGDPTAT